METHSSIGAPSLLERLKRRQLVPYFFFAAFLLLFWQVLRLLAPFYLGLLGSVILALLFSPLNAALRKRMGNRPNTAAAATTLLALLIVVAPVLLFGWISLKEADRLQPTVRLWLNGLEHLRAGDPIGQVPPRLASVWKSIESLLALWRIEPEDILLKSVDEMGQRMGTLATAIIRNAAVVLVDLMVLAFTLFFFLRDGEGIFGRLIELVPMDPEHKNVIVERMRRTLYAVLRGVLVVALVQGTLAAVGYALFGVPFPVLLGLVTTLLSPIPFVGAAGICLFVVLGLLANGSYAQAGCVAAWNLLLVCSVDNLLRPILIGQDAKLPILLLFFGLLGGLHVYGFAGLLIGPLVIALFLAFANIYRQEYRERHPEKTEPPAGKAE